MRLEMQCRLENHAGQCKMEFWVQSLQSCDASAKSRFSIFSLGNFRLFQRFIVFLSAYQALERYL